MPYNIREHVPGHEPGKPIKPAIAALYNRINTMCYVLGGDASAGDLDPWPYRKVYDSLRATVEQMLKYNDPSRQVPSYLSEAAGYREQWHALLEDLLPLIDKVNQRIAAGDYPQEIRDFVANIKCLELSEIKELTLRMFYEIHFTSDPDVLAINAKWEEILQVNETLLCLPWVYIQRNGTVVPQQEMEVHLSLIQDDNLVDLYATKRLDKNYEPNGRRRAAIIHGRGYHILSSPVPAGKGPQPAVGGGDESNEMKCVEGQCEPVAEDSFCNEADGSCSTMTT